MISKAEIRALANQTSYARGKALYEAGGVLDLVVDDSSEIHFIEAAVQGSGHNIYKVYLQFDTNMKWVEESDCDCMAYHTYPGLCKHCVAVLLAYEEYLKRQKIMIKDDRKQEATLAFLESLRGSKSEPSPKKVYKTTPGFRDILMHQQLRTTLPVLREDVYGKVKMEPHLVYDQQEFSLEFKIGIDYMYVLKDVFHFADAIENKRDEVYGQKLHFVHSIEMFTKETKGIVEFICLWARENKKNYSQVSYYGYNFGKQTTSKLRSIPLGNADLEAFIEVVGVRGFQGNIHGFSQKHWCLFEEPVERRIKMIGSDHGVSLEVHQPIGFLCAKNYIYFDNGRIYKESKQDLEPIGEFLTCVSQIPEQEVFIAKEDVPVFCKELLPVLKKFYQIEEENFDENEYGIVPADYEVYLDAPQKDFITCKVLAVYGEESYNLFDRTDHMERRDMVREFDISQTISSYFSAFDENEKVMALSGDEDKLYQLLIYGIPVLQRLAEVYISDSIKKIHVSSAPKVSVGVSLTGDLLELKMTSEDMPREQLLEILSKYNRKKKFYRLKNGDFVNVDEEGINALLELKDGLNLSEKDLRQEQIILPKYRSLYLDQELKEWQDVSTQKDKAFKALIRNMKTVEDNDFEIPPEMKDILREYQKRGYLWIRTLKHNGFCGILADDMGLGKTLQVITFLLSEQLEKKEKRRTLIVTPASLIFNWQSEIQRFAPTLPVTIVAGSAPERKILIESAGEDDILITSYDLLRRDVELYQEMEFANQVIDEAQYIKNHNTKASRAVKKMNAAFKLALTGTPVENRLSELWSIFDYLMPGFLYTYKRFREELEVPIVQDQSKRELSRLQHMIRPFVLRRLKKDVLQDLPDKMEKQYYAKMDGEQQELYDAHVKRMQLMLDQQTEEEFRTSKLQILSELTRLRQICCHPGLIFENYAGESVKMDLCMNLIQNGISGGHKILLFSQFTSMLSLLEERMKKEGISFYTLTGAVKKEKRAKLVEQFNEDDTSVFCISLKAGGTGLNLTAADIVIHYDPWWNLAVQNQATDRAHRIGQKNVVMVYQLIVQGTIEDNMRKLQERKKELADQLLTGEGMGRGSFTKEELRELLQTEESHLT